MREEGREIGDLGGRRPDPGGEGTRVRNRKAGTRVRDPQKQPGSAGHRPLRDEHRQTWDTQTQEVGGGGAGPESGGFPRRGGVSSPPQCPGGAPSQPPMLSGTQEGLSMLAAGSPPGLSWVCAGRRGGVLCCFANPLRSGPILTTHLA